MAQSGKRVERRCIFKQLHEYVGMNIERVKILMAFQLRIIILKESTTSSTHTHTHWTLNHLSSVDQAHIHFLYHIFITTYLHLKSLSVYKLLPTLNSITEQIITFVWYVVTRPYYIQWDIFTRTLWIHISYIYTPTKNIFQRIQQ